MREKEVGVLDEIIKRMKFKRLLILCADKELIWKYAKQYVKHILLK